VGSKSPGVSVELGGSTAIGSGAGGFGGGKIVYQPIMITIDRAIASRIRFSSMTVRVTVSGGALVRFAREELGNRDRVEPATAEGLATKQASQNQPTAAPGTVHLDRFERVPRAGRFETAGLAQERAEYKAIGLYKIQN
jgi:hypothetical protein